MMFQTTSTEFQDNWRRVVARAWSDPRFKDELLRNPDQVLARAGIHSPDGACFVIVENNPEQLHLVLPAAPTEEAELGEASGEAVPHYHAPCW